MKGALFARYSRSAKSLRRLFLDEFAGQPRRRAGRRRPSVGVERAEKLYARVFNEYGDDSVAQLGGAHIACEYVSNVLTKVLEWGRLMAYLEQSTRYVPYTDKLHGRWRYHVPAEVEGALRERYVAVMDAAFETYASLIDGDAAALRGAISARAAGLRRRAPRRHPRQGARHAARHAAGGDAVERRHLRHRPGVRGAAAAHARAPARRGPAVRRRRCSSELRKLIPAFLTRVDQPDRGGRWSEYLAATRDGDARSRRRRCSRASSAEPRDEVTLTDFDPDGEIKIVAAALYAGHRPARRPAAGGGARA